MNARFHLSVVETKGGKEGVLNIALVQKEVTTHIKAGENKGVTITNHNIVRSFNTQPLADDGMAQVDVPVSFKAADYALVLYVQNKKNLSVSAAVIKDLL